MNIHSIHLIGLEKYFLIIIKNFITNEDIKKSLQRKKLIAERDTSDVWRQFAIWLLVDPDDGVIRFTKPDSKEHAAINHVAHLYAQNCEDREIWEAAEAAADAARDAAKVAEHAAYLDDDDAAYWTARRGHRAVSAASAAALIVSIINNDHWPDKSRIMINMINDAVAAVYEPSAAGASAHKQSMYALEYEDYSANAAAIKDWEAADSVRFNAPYKRIADKLLELLQSAPPKDAP